MANKSKPPISFGLLDKNIYLTSELVFRNEEQALVFLDQLEKEVREIPPNKYQVHRDNILMMIENSREVLRTNGLGAAMRQLDKLTFLEVGLIEEWRRSSKAGSHEKIRKGIACAAEDLLLSNPAKTNLEVWESFGCSELPTICEADGKEFEIYLDGEQLVEVCYPGKEHSITFRTFERYMTAARKKTNSLTQ